MPSIEDSDSPTNVRDTTANIVMNGGAGSGNNQIKETMRRFKNYHEINAPEPIGVDKLEVSDCIQRIRAKCCWEFKAWPNSMV